MELTGRSRWFALTLPMVLAAASVLRPAPPGVLAARSMPERACTPGAAAGLATGGGSPGWYRLDPVLDARGTLTGRGLAVGGGLGRWSAVLPAESFVSGPVRGRVVVGEDDGRRSSLRLLDTALGCWTALGTTADVVRSAVLTPDGTILYEHRVDRSTRRDLGVWRLEASGRSSHPVPVLPGLSPDGLYGPTFETSLQVAGDGRVVVSSCGERACRTRVLDPATGAIAAVNGTGPAAGLAGGRLIALEPCDGLPCTVDAFDLATGSATKLDEADGPALAAPGIPGVVVLADEGGLGVVRLSSAASDLEVPAGVGLAPVVASSTADSGVETPPGRVAVAPGGRVTDPSVVRFLDPADLQLTASEVLP